MQLYNAPQLVRWCLHFISTNYLPLSARPEWSQLSDANLQHIEEHRWPPLEYLEQVKEYEELCHGHSYHAKKRSGVTCLIM